MRTTSRTRRYLGSLLLTLGLGLAWPAAAVEIFDYKVTYDGVFTAFKEVGIGDARLDVAQTAAVVDDEPLVRARLTATSAAYPLVESVYPFRYEFTSYHQRQTPRTLAYERRKQGKRLRHDLLLADWEQGSVSRFGIDAVVDVQQDGVASDALLATLRRAGMPDYRGLLAPHPAKLEAPANALDRLALLQQLRRLPMEEGAVHELTVTDGKEIIRYQARVALREEVTVGTGSRTAWKVRIDGFEAADREVYATDQESAAVAVAGDTERLRHPPVYVWIDSGPRRVPLRLVSHHAVGKFTVTLDAERTVQSAALPAGEVGSRTR